MEKKPKEDELPLAVKRKYEVEWKVGEGTYGVVYKATHKENGAIVAIKKFKASSPVKGEGEGEGISLTAYREIMARYPNIHKPNFNNKHFF